ncbi:hypothetical protein [Elizabethkingia anophelis]|uniref:hypothetical protein n=1 Tax=Elizabethkingia anophelis TaxID=1117645 RepID=UPI0032084E59
MKSKNVNYNYLIGKDREEILEDLGEGFNFYPDENWFYELKKNWLGKKTVLLIHFNNNIVERIEILKYYGQYPKACMD